MRRQLSESYVGSGRIDVIAHLSVSIEGGRLLLFLNSICLSIVSHLHLILQTWLAFLPNDTRVLFLCYNFVSIVLLADYYILKRLPPFSSVSPFKFTSLFSLSGS